MSIATEINRLTQAKNSIKEAIEAKGVEVGDTTIDGYAAKIDSIESSFTICEDDFNYFLQGGEEKMKIFDNIDMSRCTNATYFLNNAKLDKDKQPLTTIDLTNMNFGEGTNIDNGNYMFNGITNCTTFILPDNDDYNIRATNYMFGGFNGSKITNLEHLHDDTGSSATNDKRNMFRGCSNLLEADLSGFTARVCTANMWQNTFYQCNKLRKVWLPSTCININATTYAGGSMMNASNAACVIFTDAPAKLSTWVGYWNYYNASTQCEVRYGSTHAEYEAY